MIGIEKMSKNVGLPADAQQNSSGANVKIVRITTPSNIKIQPVDAEAPAPQPTGETFVHRAPVAVPPVAPTVSAAVVQPAATPAMPPAADALLMDSTSKSAPKSEPKTEPEFSSPFAEKQKLGATPKLIGLAVGLSAVIAIMLVFEMMRGGGSEDVASQPNTTPGDIVAALKPTTIPAAKPTPLSVQAASPAEPVRIVKPERKAEPVQPAVVAEEPAANAPVESEPVTAVAKVAVPAPVASKPAAKVEPVAAPVVASVTPKPTPVEIIAEAPKPEPEIEAKVEAVTPVIAVKPSNANDEFVAQITSGTLAALRGATPKPLVDPAASKVLNRVKEALAAGQSRFEIERMLNTAMSSGAIKMPAEFIRGDGRVNTAAIFSRVFEN